EDVPAATRQEEGHHQEAELVPIVGGTGGHGGPGPVGTIAEVEQGGEPLANVPAREMLLGDVDRAGVPSLADPVEHRLDHLEADLLDGIEAERLAEGRTGPCPIEGEQRTLEPPGEAAGRLVRPPD